MYSQNMDKKNSANASSTWACKHGCKVTKDPCQHLEALLPNPVTGDRNRPSFALAYVEDIEYTAYKYGDDGAFVMSDDKVKEFQREMRYCGLKEHEVDLLTAYYCHNMTYEEIVESLDLDCCVATVHNRIKRAKALVRKAHE